MKKLLLLFLAVAGYVSSVNADTHTYTVVGSSAEIFGGAWDPTLTTNDMTLIDGVYVKKYTNVELSSGTILFKVAKDHAWEGSYNYTEINGGNADYTVNLAGIYDITFTFSPDKLSNGNYILCEMTPHLYFAYGTDNWDNLSIVDEVAMSNGVYTKTFNGEKDHTFALAYTYGATKSALVRPVTEGSWYDIFIQHMGGNTTTDGTNVWYLKEDATYTFTYYSAYNSFTLEAETSESMGTAGWRTYSTGNYYGSNGYKISGADVAAYYVSGTGAGKATLTSIPDGTVIPTKEGIILKGSGSFTVTTTDETPATLTGNMLVGSGGTTVDVPTSTGYVLGGSGSTLGFYQVDGSDVTLGAHKAYLNVTSPAHIFFGLDDESTGINDVNVEKENAPIYNLQGIRLAQPQKGLNIINGKKVLTK